MVLVAMSLVAAVIFTTPGNATFGNNSALTIRTFDAIADPHSDRTYQAVDYVPQGDVDEFVGCYTDALTLYASHTTDGGATYLSPVTVGGTTQSWCQIHAFASGFLIGSGTRVYYTASLLSPWTARTVIVPPVAGAILGGCMAAMSPNSAVMVILHIEDEGSYSFFSNDGGVTWGMGHYTGTGINSGICGVVFGGNSNNAAFVDYNVGLVTRTINGGVTWGMVSSGMLNVGNIAFLPGFDGGYSSSYVIAIRATVSKPGGDDELHPRLFAEDSITSAGTSFAPSANWPLTFGSWYTSYVATTAAGGLVMLGYDVEAGTGFQAFFVDTHSANPIVRGPVITGVVSQATGVAIRDVASPTSSNENLVVVRINEKDYYITSNDAAPTGGPTPTPTPTPVPGPAPPPQGAGDASSWVNEPLDTGGIVPGNICMDNDGENVGLLFSDVNDQKTAYFMLRDALTGQWTRYNDITGADLYEVRDCRLIHTGTNTWTFVSFGNSGANVRLAAWKSADNGATWALSGIITTNTNTCLQDADGSESQPGYIGVVFTTSSGCATPLNFVESSNGGTTWSTVQRLNDNSGAESVSPTATIALGSGSVRGKAAISAINTGGTSGPGWSVMFNSPTQIFSVITSDGTFWSVPYTANLGTTPNPITIPGACSGATPTLLTLTHEDLPFEVDHASSTISFAYTNTAKNYFCLAEYAVGGVSQGIPAVPPTNTQTGPVGGSKQLTTQVGGAQLMATADLVANSNSIWYRPGVNDAWTLSKTNPVSDSGVYAIKLTPTRGYWCYTNESIGGRLECEHAGVFTAAGNPEAPLVADVAVTNLVGFDVDAQGAVAIARLDLGETVQVFEGASLTPGATDGDPDCISNNDGVAALATGRGVFVSYVECDGSGDTDTIKIRNGQLGAPLAGDCAGTGDTLNQAFPSSLDIPNELDQIQDLASIPYDYSQCNPGGIDDTQLAWAFSEETGAVGVYVVSQQNSDTDHDAVATINFRQTVGEVAQICSFGGPDGANHLVAITPLVTSKAYLPVGGRTQIPETGGAFASASITMQYSLGSPFSQGSSVDCARERGIMVSYPDGRVGVVCLLAATYCENGVARGQPYWTHTSTFPGESRTAALSGDGQWAAYLDNDNDTIDVVNALTGEFRAFISQPQASTLWHSMKMDQSGGSLWLAYENHIYRYSIGNTTCQTDCSNDNLNPDDTDGDGILDGADPDIDGDGAGNCSDPDTDGDGIANTVDPDDDNDGTLDAVDSSPRGAGSCSNVSGGGNIVGGGGSIDQQVEAVDSVFGAGAMMLSIIYILLFAAAGYMIFGESIAGMILGAVLGFAYTVFLGAMPPIITFGIIAICLLIGGMRLFGSSSDGGV